MLFNEGYRQEFPFDNDIDININNTNQNVNANMNTMGNAPMGGCPVTEPMRERVVQRTILHEVPQV